MDTSTPRILQGYGSALYSFKDCRDLIVIQSYRVPKKYKIATVNFRFYSCLKEVDGYSKETADFIGHIFFDVIAKKCFVFEERSICRSYYLYFFCEFSKIETTVKLCDSPRYN